MRGVFLSILMILFVGCGGGGGEESKSKKQPYIYQVDDITLNSTTPKTLQIDYFKGDGSGKVEIFATSSDSSIVTVKILKSYLDSKKEGLIHSILEISPAKGSCGEVEITLTLKSILAQVIKRFKVKIICQNNPPVANSDSFETFKDESIKMDVLKNDFDKDKEPLKIVQVTTPKGGTAKIVDNYTKILYTPNGNFIGVDSFSYTVADSSNAKSTAVVKVNVKQPINQWSCQETKRPKLWLRDDILEFLIENRSNNSLNWQRFKSMCDALTDNDPNNDPWGSNTSAGSDYTPQAFTAPLALMYYLTKDAKYADKAIEFMQKTDTNISKYGDPDHKGYEKLALAYDWLHSYSGMTSQVKAEFHNKMRAISDNFWVTLNRSASGTDSDQNLLTGALHIMYGVALSGDFSDAKDIYDRGWFGWESGFNGGITNRDTVKEALGGVYFTGMAYLPSTDIVGIMENWLSLETGCNYSFALNEQELMPFWRNLIKALISLTDPKREIVEDYGSWQDPNTLSTQPWLYRALNIMSYFAFRENSKEAKYAKYFRDNVNIGYKNDPFLEYLFDIPDSNLSDESPYISGNLPLVYLAKAPDFLLYRDSWSANATWITFRGDGNIPMDQQAPDHGHFSIYKDGEYLTKGVRNYEALANGDFFNTLSIANSCSVNNQSCSGTALMFSQKKAKITRANISTNPLFAYVMMNADGQWNDDPSRESNPNLNVKSYRRHFFVANSYVVIFDRVRTQNSVNIKYRLRALSEPTITLQTVKQSSISGNSTLLHKTLIPSNVTITKVDENQLWPAGTDYDWKITGQTEKHWQSVIDFGQQNSLNILNVIQIGDSTLNSFDTLETIDTASLAGVRIGSWVVVFAKDETLLDTLTYTIQSANSPQHHLIADLKPKSYDIFVNGSKLKTIQVVDGNNSLYFETTISGNLTIEIK
jgi:hypothetical protein